MAAGGIVMRREQPPLIAVVRLRKRDEWVLPKGKLDDGETARAAARREVLEETGHNVTVHEFLGTLVYESGGRSKVVHYWRMEAANTQTRELMNDVRAVDWLPLDAAIARLSRAYERTFLENVGPLAVSVLSRRLKARAQAQVPVAKAPPAVKAPPATKAAPAKKRRIKPSEVGLQVPVVEPVSVPPVETEVVQELPAMPEPVANDMVTPEVSIEPEPSEAPIESMVSEAPGSLVDEEFIPQPDAAEAAAAEDDSDDRPDPDGKARKSLAQKVRNWLGRAA
jgi:8-oxo-dGTP diphosphatase